MKKSVFETTMKRYASENNLKVRFDFSDGFKATFNNGVRIFGREDSNRICAKTPNHVYMKEGLAV